MAQPLLDDEHSPDSSAAATATGAAAEEDSQGVLLEYILHHGAAIGPNSSIMQPDQVRGRPFLGGGGVALEGWLIHCTKHRQAAVYPMQPSMPAFPLSCAIKSTSKQLHCLCSPRLQVALYLPSGAHPRAGVLRAVARDHQDAGPPSDSTGASALASGRLPYDSWVDSDGRLGDNLQPPLRGGFPQLRDGEWHHVMLITGAAGDGGSTSSDKGFQLYVDGQLRGEMAAGATRSGDGSELQVRGVGGGGCMVTVMMSACVLH